MPLLRKVSDPVQIQRVLKVVDAIGQVAQHPKVKVDVVRNYEVRAV